MKVLPAGLQNHLDSGATNMVYCWRVVRKDGQEQGFTEHDTDITFGSLTYSASSGFTASRVQQQLGLSVDNLNLDGVLDSVSINEDDLAAGRYDDALVELFWVRADNPAQRVMITRGNIGEVKRGETGFSAEFRSIAHRLQQVTGRTFQRYCDAQVGDSRCGVNLNTAAFRSTGTVTAAQGREIQLADLSAFADGWFTHGVIKFTSGENDGLSFEVRAHAGNVVSLWQIPPFQVAAGTTYEMTAGCQKDNIVCRTKFNNIRNFRGFPFMPGNDVVTDYAVQGSGNMDGGSLGIGREP